MAEGKKEEAKRDDPEQSRRFEEIGKELTDESSAEAFERLFKKVTDLKPIDPKSRSKRDIT